MRTWKQGVASLLAASMLVSVLPPWAMAAENPESPPAAEEGLTPENEEVKAPEKEGEESPKQEEAQETQKQEVPPPAAEASLITGDEVIYNLGSEAVMVGNDEFDENGNYTIPLTDSAPFFPYEVQFTWQDTTVTEWFMDPEDTVEIGGHTFSVESHATESNTLSQIGVWVGDQYIPVYPEEKTFTETPQPEPYSLLPLEERNATLDLRDLLPIQLKKLKLKTALSNLKDSAKVVMYSVDDDGDTVEIYDRESDTVDLYSGNYYSDYYQDIWSTDDEIYLIVGDGNQLNPQNIRYNITVKLPKWDWENRFRWAVCEEGSDGSRNSLEVGDVKLYKHYYNSDEETYGEYELYLSSETIKNLQPVWLGFDFAKSYPGIDLKVYAESEDGSLSDITEDIWKKTDLAVEGGYKGIYDGKSAYYIEFLQDGETFDSKIQFRVNLMHSGINLEYVCLEYGNEDSRSHSLYSLRQDDNWDGGEDIHAYMINSSFPADESYFAQLSYVYDGRGIENTKLNKYIAKSVVSNEKCFENLEEAVGEDVTLKLFFKGYFGGDTADFSHEQYITIFTKDNPEDENSAVTAHKYHIRIQGSDNFYPDEFSVSKNGLNCVSKPYDYSNDYNQYSWVYDKDNNRYRLYQFYPKAGYSSDGQYYLRACHLRSTPAYGEDALNQVEMAVEGFYSSIQEAKKAGRDDIKEKLFGEGYGPKDYSVEGGVKFTVFDKATKKAHQFAAQIIDPSTRIKPDDLKSEEITVPTSYWDDQTDEESGITTWAAKIRSDKYPKNGDYSLSLRYYYDGDLQENLTHFELYTVEGHEVKTLAEAKNKDDITSQIFGSGYLHNFTEPLTISVFDKYHKEPIRLTFEILASDDQDFEVATIQDQNGKFANGRYDYTDGRQYWYKIEYNSNNRNAPNDSYVRNGFRTILVSDPAFDLTHVNLTFDVDDRSQVFRDGTNVTKGDTNVDFSKGPVQYNVKAENDVSNRNYWVTIKKQESGPKLFVNGITDPEKAERVMFLVEENGYHEYHDIFIANIGDQPLTDLEVKLEGASDNIALDEYWTIGGNSSNNTLQGFYHDTDSGYSYDNQTQNNAKVRIKRTGKGTIAGTLVISATEQDESGQPKKVEQRITLTGIAGQPELKEKIKETAVKFVPYSSGLMTDNMFDWMKETYEVLEEKDLSSEEREEFENMKLPERTVFGLPEGINLTNAGEIYGVPMKEGSYVFKVRVKFEIDEDKFPSYDGLNGDYGELEFKPQTSEFFTLTVNSNTKENVEASNEDPTYKITKIPEEQTAYAEHVFLVDNINREEDLIEFQDLYIDGKKLIKDTDYTVEEGSTKATIAEKTFERHGEGEHTIAAEFRVDGDRKKDLKTASQNYNIKTKPTDDSGGGGGGGGGGSSRPKNTPKPTPTPKPVPTPMSSPSQNTFELTSPPPVPTPDPLATPLDTIFKDVKRDAWYYNEVNWAYRGGLMIGTGEGQFSPEEKTSMAMVTTVLARLHGAVLGSDSDVAGTPVPAGEWYSATSAWAWRNGLISSVGFTGNEPLPRGRMAIILTKYLDLRKLPYVLPENPMIFADAGSMSEEELKAFQLLYSLGIFKGVGGGYMNPQEGMTRAELAALLYRVSSYMNQIRQ